MVFSRNSQYTRIATDSYRQTVSGYWRGLGILTLASSCSLAIELSAVEKPALELVKNRYFDFVGSDYAFLQDLEYASQSILLGCRSSFNWPAEFPKPVLVQVTEQVTPRVRKSSVGNINLQLAAESNPDVQSEWLTRALLTQYSFWKGFNTPPPIWLVRSIRILGALEHKPQARVLLLRQLMGQSVPSLAQRVSSYDRTSNPAWDFLLYKFLESGGHEKRMFSQRLEQFWANGYDWSQLSLFFTPRYDKLNAAELELLWRTFVAEILAVEPAACLSETASQEALGNISTFEILKNNQPTILTTDVWYLYRNDAAASKVFWEKQSGLEVLAISVHPYYFNACHSLDRVFLSIQNDDLDAYREAARQFKQDMLDAQQLSFETDRLLKRICP